MSTRSRSGQILKAIEATGHSIGAHGDDAADPPWSWEEFQALSTEQQVTTYSAYFDRRYGDVTILSESECPVDVMRFDLRDSAREASYGRWLNNMGKEEHPGDLAKGVLVRLLVGHCEKEDLTVLVNDEQQFDVTVHIEVVDTWVDFWFL